MQFRYKVTPDYFGSVNLYYRVKIQRYHKCYFGYWETIYNDSLQYLLKKINTYAFDGYKYLCNVSQEDLYNELQQYKSMNDIIMTYIHATIKTDKCKSKYTELIEQFVLTNKWVTLDIKENSDE